MSSANRSATGARLRAALDDAGVQSLARILLVFAAIFAFVMGIAPGTGDPIEGGDKVLHMLAFGTLAVLAAVGLPRTGILLLFAILAAAGGAIEWIQSWPIVNRDAQFADFLADAIASLAGLLFVRVWLRA